MENKNKKRILVGVLIVLILTNLFTLGTFGYKKYCRFKQHGAGYHGEERQFNPNDRIKHFVKKELMLDSEQFKEFCALKDSNFKNSNEIWEVLASLRKTSMLEIAKDKPDSLRLVTLSDSIGLFNKKMQLEMNHHFISVKKILKSEQIKKYNEMLLNIGNGEGGKHDDRKVRNQKNCQNGKDRR